MPLLALLAPGVGMGGTETALIAATTVINIPMRGRNQPVLALEGRNDTNVGFKGKNDTNIRLTGNV